MFCFSYNLKNSSIFIFVKLLKKSGYLSLNGYLPEIRMQKIRENIFIFYNIAKKNNIKISY